MKIYYQPIFKYTFKFACSEDIYEHNSTVIFKTEKQAMSWAKKVWKEIKGEDDVLIDIEMRNLIINPL